MKYKSLIFITILIPITAFAIFMTTAYIRDPLQLYHKNWFGTPKLVDNMREQAYGLIHHYDFDSVIIGSSMLENTSAQEASRLLGGKFINLSLSGAIEYEKAEILNFAIKRKKIKHIITSLDTYFSGNKKYEKDYPAGLYTGTPRIKAYLNQRYFYCILKGKKTPECIGTEKDFDHPNYWADNLEFKDKFGNYTKWSAIKQFVFSEEQAQYPTTELIRKNWRDTYISLVKNNPQTQFSFIVPPQTLFKFAVLEHRRDPFLKHYKDALQYLIKELQNEKNVSFYWFYDTKFPKDVRFYKDQEHYSAEVNSFILKAVAKKSHCLTSKNFDKKFNNFERKISEFNLTPYLKNIKALPD